VVLSGAFNIDDPDRMGRDRVDSQTRKKTKTPPLRIFIYALMLALLLSVTGCGIRMWSASTEANYEITPDGKKIFYSSNKEMQGLILEVSDIDDKIHTVKISVDKSSTSEAAVAAALQSQLNIQAQLMRLIDQLAPLAAAAKMGGS
jgi:hypothetical protein